jgi:hypothetical protein
MRLAQPTSGSGKAVGAMVHGVCSHLASSRAGPPCLMVTEPAKGSLVSRDGPRTQLTGPTRKPLCRKVRNVILRILVTAVHQIRYPCRCTHYSGCTLHTAHCWCGFACMLCCMPRKLCGVHRTNIKYKSPQHKRTQCGRGREHRSGH